MRRSWSPMLLVLVAGTLPAGVAHAQAAATTPAQTTLSVIDEDPIPSARAQAMGGALAPVADDLDAAFHNPAGIGGLGNQTSKNDSWVHKLYFPTVSGGANSNGAGLAQDLKKSGATNDATIGETVIDANAGKRDYGRVNAAVGMVLGRIIVVPFQDLQLATTPRGGGSNLLDTTYRDMSGVGYGLSLQDSSGRLSFGYFGYTASRTETQGALLYGDLDNIANRDAAIKAATKSYSGSGSNAGVVWKMGKSGVAAFGLNVKNLGNTTFTGSGGSLVVKQDVDAGFALTPKLGKMGDLNFVVQMDGLTDPDVSLVEKYRVGLELELGGVGSYATFALRAGYNHAGPSGGLMLNLGLLAVEASSYAVDLAADNGRTTERREGVTLYVNVADF